MPGYQLELTVAYPPRLDTDPEDYWRWAILDSLRRSLVELDFRDDNLARCGGGLGDDWYASYRDRFEDERCYLTYGTDDGGMRQMPIHHGVYGLCRVAGDLRSAQVRFLDDVRMATGSTHRGVRALAQAFVYELEHRERCGGRWSFGGAPLDWPPVRSRVSLAQTRLPGRDLLLISDEGDAFVKVSAAAAVVALARLIADDLGPADDDRGPHLRTLADAFEAASVTTSTPPPAVLVLPEEISAAELLVDQVRLRARLPVRETDRCVDCGVEALGDRPVRASAGPEITVGVGSPMIGPVWPVDEPRRSICRRCSSGRAVRRSVHLCRACAQVLPFGLIERCPRCRREPGGPHAEYPYYWFSPPARTDGARREYQPGADPRDAVPR